MKIRLEVNSEIKEAEIIIKCSEVNDKIIEIQKKLSKINIGESIEAYIDEKEIYLNINQILFFETEKRHIFVHTINNSMKVKYKLYELEEFLPNNFLRISKSTVVNIDKIYSLTKNITGASKVEFLNSEKTVYASRKYFEILKEKIKIRRLRNEKI